MSVVETQLRQQTRLLQTVLAALQSSGATDGLLELPHGIVLPAKSLQQLLDIEKLLDNEATVHKMVCYYAQLFRWKLEWKNLYFLYLFLFILNSLSEMCINVCFFPVYFWIFVDFQLCFTTYTCVNVCI